MTASVVPSDISPDVLTDGRWETVRGVQRWVRDITTLIACPKCLATMTEPCRTPTGVPALSHSARLVGRVCRCGMPLAAKCRACESCRADVRRAQWRAYKSRIRQDVVVAMEREAG